MSNPEKLDELEAATIAGAIAALDISVVDSEHGPATIVSSEAAAAMKLAGDFEEIVRDLREGRPE